MKPDTPNPGSSLPAAEAGSVNVQKITAENPSLATESSPNPTNSAGAAFVAPSAPQDSSNITDAQSSRAEAASTSSFQEQIAQLPAEDTNRIETEWVSKAEEIEYKTAGDPYFEDDAHHELSRAYLKKRFGMDVK